MITLDITRLGFTPQATEGDLAIDGQRECATLEDYSPWDRVDVPITLETVQRLKRAGSTCIPPGVFGLVLHHSPTFGPDTLMLTDVPGFTYIYIHAGNAPADTLGCVLVGADAGPRTDAWIGRSRVALKALRATVVPRLKTGELGQVIVMERR